MNLCLCLCFGFSLSLCLGLFLSCGLCRRFCLSLFCCSLFCSGRLVFCRSLRSCFRLSFSRGLCFCCSLSFGLGLRLLLSCSLRFSFFLCQSLCQCLRFGFSLSFGLYLRFSLCWLFLRVLLPGGFRCSFSLGLIFAAGFALGFRYSFCLRPGSLFRRRCDLCLRSTDACQNTGGLEVCGQGGVKCAFAIGLTETCDLAVLLFDFFTGFQLLLPPFGPLAAAVHQIADFCSGHLAEVNLLAALVLRQGGQRGRQRDHHCQRRG